VFTTYCCAMTALCNRDRAWSFIFDFVVSVVEYHNVPQKLGGSRPPSLGQRRQIFTEVV